MRMAYTLITANRNYSSWSLRPWLLMKALGIPFTDRVEPFVQPESYDAFRSFSPTGLVPVLLDGDRRVWDSLGIALYLADRHDGVWPQGEDARAFAQAIVAEMHSGFGHLRNDCSMSLGVRIALKPKSPGLERNLARLRDLLAEALDRFGGPWLAGPQFSAADAFYAPVAFRIRTYGLDAGRGQEWVDRILFHPAMQQWEAEGLAETWRDDAHEAEIMGAGTVTADYRQS
jgi:glutathione S-transferase